VLLEAKQSSAILSSVQDNMKNLHDAISRVESVMAPYTAGTARYTAAGAAAAQGLAAAAGGAPPEGERSSVQLDWRPAPYPHPPMPDPPWSGPPVVGRGGVTLSGGGGQSSAGGTAGLDDRRREMLRSKDEYVQGEF
jgi:hypothetical protein